MTDPPAAGDTHTDRPSAKRRRRRIFPAGLALLSALAVLALFAVRRSNELELTISVDEDRPYQGEIIMMTLTVENVSGRAVEGDRWASVGPEECIGATGLPLELSLYYGPLTSLAMRLRPEPGNLGHTVLPPGTRMELRCNVAEAFNMLKPGRYVLEGGYFRDRWARRPALRLPARLWGSLVEHDPLYIEVRARSYDDPAKR